MTWTNALSRFVLCPLAVAIGDSLFAGVSYANAGQWVLVGFVLAAFSIAGDMTRLDRMGHTGAFLTDTLSATLVVWASQFVLPGVAITFTGALLTGLILGLSEAVMHRRVQMSRRRGVRERRP